ncbi:MAG: PglZ protein [Bacteroidetes bacterium]|nr:PglZ protein [Bacteroidota bacterium]
MSSWVDKFKNIIYSSHREHIIVCDRDNLFSYPELSSGIQEDGYRVINCHSPLDVRISFELNVRNVKEKCIIVAPVGYKPLPDMAISVHFNDIGMKELFPKLDSKALKGLSFNALCTLSNIKHYEELGQDRTLKFLLENLYGLDFDSLTASRAKERVLNALITVLLEKNGVNEALMSYLSTLAKPYFPTLINQGLSKENLLQFIQENWNNFAKGKETGIDFSESSLSKSIGFLFIRDYLVPISVSKEQYESVYAGFRIGLKYNSNEATQIEIQALIEYLNQQLVQLQDLHEEWFTVVQVLAKTANKVLALNSEDQKKSFKEVVNKLNDRFQRYLENNYWSVFTLSGVRKPFVVTRILEYMKAQPEKKKALIVIDGMNYWQWELISEHLRKSGIDCNTKTTMAYIPSITAWSRQAIFKGGKPDLDKDNSNESKLYKDYWKQASYQDFQIHYEKFGANSLLDLNAIGNNIEILGLVCNDLDDIMHGTILGNEQLRQSTLQWIEKIKLERTIMELKNRGFKCFITSDHGNIEAKGINNLKLSDKFGSVSRGKRHIRFTNETLFNGFIEQNKDLKFVTRDLSVYLKDENAFTNEEKVVITHGGSHLWEVLVPFVEI